jgi:ligand-binding sensor domain-containing protein/signal transduction histidine kinase
MKNFRLFLVVAAGLVIAPALWAQKIVFDKVSINEDNPTARITGITQDRDGYMWFSSNGIAKFDGYQLTHFVNDPLNPNSIASNQVECIYTDSTGTIWIGTNGKGLDKFDPANGIFTHYKHQPKNTFSLNEDRVTAIAKDKDDLLWIGTVHGLDRLNPKTGKFDHFLHDSKNNNSLSNDHINSIFVDHEGTVWVGTGASVDENKNPLPDEGGLNKFDPKTGGFTRYLQADQQGLQYSRIHALFEDRKGNFWVGTSHNRLFRMDREKGVFEYYSNDAANPDKFSAPSEKRSAAIPEDFITFISEDAAGGIWIGTMTNGINRYDPTTRKTTHFESNSGGPFTENTGLYAYSSGDGLFWISTMGGGLYKIDPILNTIPHYSTSSPAFAIYEDPDNTLWIGTANGLMKKDQNNGSVQQFSYDPFNPASLSNNIVFSIYEDRQNRLWIGTDGGGLNVLNKSTRAFAIYRHESNNKQSLVNDVVYAMCEDGDRNMWVGTGNGLDLMDRGTGRFTHYLHDSKDTASIGNNFIETIIRDNDNNIWIGSGYRGGINQLDRSSGKFVHFLRSRSIFSLFQDADHTLWAGTDSGLYYRKPSAAAFAEFSSSNLDINSAAVICIVEDAQKKLWLNTSLGIIELDHNREVMGLYGKRYGLAPTNYVLRAGYASPKGEVLFSGNDGYYSISQDLLTPNLKPPRLMVTDFRLMDQSVKPGTGPLNQEINNTKELRLNYKQNVFSFDFAALDYTSPEDNQHFFMLENYDNGWHKSGTDRKAYYFNVPPGHYIFRIKGLNGNGFGAEKKIDIIISPPWWRTWWAYTLFAAIIGGSIWGIIYYRGRKLRLKNKLLEDTVNRRTNELQQSLKNLQSAQSQLIQSEKMASLGELTAGIAHEIQNPLNFVNNFSEVNSEMLAEMKNEILAGNKEEALLIASTIEENEKKINQHGKRADAIVKGMLQHSRKSTGMKESTDISVLADEYLRLSYHGLRAKEKSFNATMLTDFTSNMGKINIIPQDMGRVLLNLFNNAFYSVMQRQKQSGENYSPTVSVSTKKIGDKADNYRMEIRVKDNGMGIPKKVVDKIFQPFFTTKPTGQGTGLGLSLSYDIIKAHGGEINVETKEGEGAEFIIRMPL